MKVLLMSIVVCALGAATIARAEKPADAKQSPADNAQQADRAQKSANAHADNAQKAEQAEQAKQEASKSAAKMPKDPNYRWYHGRWWYWQNNGWLVWNGNRWIPHQRTASNAQRRSYSYQQPAAGVAANGESFVPTEQAFPRTDGSGMRNSFSTPGTVRYQKVLPSFGIRSAGSKILGEY